MPRFSANLGYLWADLPIAKGIHRAAKAGFAAVECHYPYDQNLSDIHAALEKTGLPMLSLNTRTGDEPGMLGLSALSNRRGEARAAIDEALSAARILGASSVHVLAGKTHASDARDTFLGNLAYACEQAEAAEITILIEPLNPYDAPGYFLHSTEQAIAIIREIERNNLKLMFDCYHVGRTEAQTTDALIARLRDLLPYVGHIQFAGVPERGAPDRGTIDYHDIFAAVDSLGWHRPIGAEFTPDGETENSLAWLKQWSTAER